MEWKKSKHKSNTGAKAPTNHNTMAQITAQFYRPKSIYNKTLEKVVIRTGKATIAEAFEVACNNGHNPFKNIRFITEE